MVPVVAGRRRTAKSGGHPRAQAGTDPTSRYTSRCPGMAERQTHPTQNRARATSWEFESPSRDHRAMRDPGRTGRRPRGHGPRPDSLRSSGDRLASPRQDRLRRVARHPQDDRRLRLCPHDPARRPLRRVRPRGRPRQPARHQRERHRRGPAVGPRQPGPPGAGAGAEGRGPRHRPRRRRQLRLLPAGLRRRRPLRHRAAGPELGRHLRPRRPPHARHPPARGRDPHDEQRVSGAHRGDPRVRPAAVRAARAARDVARFGHHRLVRLVAARRAPRRHGRSAAAGGGRRGRPAAPAQGAPLRPRRPLRRPAGCSSTSIFRARRGAGSAGVGRQARNRPAADAAGPRSMA